jgi:hypothetical protein
MADSNKLAVEMEVGSLYHDNVGLTQMDEEMTVRTLNCHYCKKRISITTVPEFIAFCDIDCAENWKKGF